MEKNHGARWSSQDKTNAEKRRESPDPSCPRLEENMVEESVPPFVSRMRQKVDEFENTERAALTKDEPVIFYFDLETSSLDVDCDILQISVRSGESHFTSFVTPTKAIDEKASQVNKLTIRKGKLYKCDQQVETETLDQVLEKMVQHLASFKKKCLLVAHYCPFDSRRLLEKLQANRTRFAKFKALLYGFVDSYEMFVDKYPERKWVKGRLTLSTLVQESLGMSTADAHDAGVDTFLLQKLLQHHFSDKQIVKYRVTLDYALQNQRYWTRR